MYLYNGIIQFVSLYYVIFFFEKDNRICRQTTDREINVCIADHGILRPRCFVRASRHVGEIFDKCAIAENHFTSCLLLII